MRFLHAGIMFFLILLVNIFIQNMIKYDKFSIGVLSLLDVHTFIYIYY